MNRHEGTISSRLDAKLANGRAPWEFPGPEGSGHASLWIRLPELLDMSAAALAIIGDFVPFGIGQALGKRAGGNSLDNTLRVAASRADRRGCSPTCACTRSPTASATGWCTSGPRTAPCSGPRASRRSCGRGATITNEPLTELEGDVQR